jgi:hypothetical protein
MNKILVNMLHARTMLVACGVEFNSGGVWRRAAASPHVSVGEQQLAVACPCWHLLVWGRLAVLCR